MYVLAGKREVFFEANGVPRVVEVIDKAAETVVGKKAVRERADLSILGSVGAPMAGTVIEVQVKPGMAVAAGQQLVILSAMKMETAVCAPVAGTITQVRYAWMYVYGFQVLTTCVAEISMLRSQAVSINRPSWIAIASCKICNQERAKLFDDLVFCAGCC